MLLLVAFVGGTVVMAFEIAGVRVLAPYFGTDVYVWASIISVVLAALSIGNYLGGVTADRFPKPQGLALILLAASAGIPVVPQLAKPLCEPIADAFFAAHFGPLIAALILFTPASLLLGMVSPYAIRLSAASPQTIGRVAGKVYAVSTLGSIFGTLLCAFFLIPTFGVRLILWQLSAVSAITAAGLWAWATLLPMTKRG